MIRFVLSQRLEFFSLFNRQNFLQWLERYFFSYSTFSVLPRKSNFSRLPVNIGIFALISCLTNLQPVRLQNIDKPASKLPLPAVKPQDKLREQRNRQMSRRAKTETRDTWLTSQRFKDRCLSSFFFGVISPGPITMI